MSRKLLMGDLVLRCRRRCDMEGDDTIKDVEWKSLISEQYGHLFAVVVKAGMRYFEDSEEIEADGSESYALPENHDSTIGIDRIVDASSGRKFELGELMVQERNLYSGHTGDATCYSIAGQSVVLFPRPSSGTYLHVYIPQSPDISAAGDDDEIDLVTADGEAFLVWGVTVKALAKRDRFSDLAIQERNAAEVRFSEDCTLRAFVNPRRRVVRPAPGLTGGWDDYGLDDDPGSWRFR